MARDRVWLVGVGLAAAIALWIYSPAFHAYLIDDDFQWIDGAMQLGAAQAFRIGERTHFYRPVVELYFSAMYAAFGCSAMALHIASVSIHIVNATLVGVLARRVGGSAALAAAASVLFAAQQAPAQAVLWPAAVSALLSATFGLLMIIADREQPRSVGRASARRPFLVGLFYVLAMGCHESGVMWLPAALLLRYGCGERPGVRHLLRDYRPSLLLLAGYLALTAWINSHNYVITEGRYRPGLHVASNLFAYLVALYAGHRVVAEYVFVTAVVAALLWKGSDRVRAWTLWILAALLPFLAFTTGPASRYAYTAAVPFSMLVAAGILRVASLASRSIGLDLHSRNRVFGTQRVAAAVAVLLTTFVGARSAAFARKGAEGFLHDAARYEQAARNPTTVDGIDPQYLGPLARVAACQGSDFFLRSVERPAAFW